MVTRIVMYANVFRLKQWVRGACRQEARRIQSNAAIKVEDHAPGSEGSLGVGSRDVRRAVAAPQGLPSSSRFDALRFSVVYDTGLEDMIADLHAVHRTNAASHITNTALRVKCEPHTRRPNTAGLPTTPKFPPPHARYAAKIKPEPASEVQWDPKPAHAQKIPLHPKYAPPAGGFSQTHSRHAARIKPEPDSDAEWDAKLPPDQNIPRRLKYEPSAARLNPVSPYSRPYGDHGFANLDTRPTRLERGDPDRAYRERTKGGNEWQLPPQRGFATGGLGRGRSVLAPGPAARYGYV